MLPYSCLLKNFNQHRRKTMDHQHISLESLCVSEHTENIYAQIIAEEDMGESYGKKVIIQERVSISR